MNKKFSVLLALILCALVAQAQDTPPDANWESDPLDVLETPQSREVPAPTVPEFKEIDSVPRVQDVSPPAPEISELPEQSESPQVPVQKAKNSQRVVQPEMSVMSGSAEPDYTREAEFHRVYKTYNEQPTSDEAWEKAAGSRKAEIYKVQKGDTLSGISTTFFGDQFFWPKVWSLNSGKILNPHEIVPGLNVQFFPGNIEDAPTLQVAENNAEEQMIETHEKNGNDAIPAEVKKTSGPFRLPPPKARTPLLQKLPQSLPSYRMGNTLSPALQVEIGLQKNKFATPLEYLDYYLDDKPIVAVGSVVGTETDSKLAGNYQYIFVKLDQQTDKDYVVQKNLLPLKDIKAQSKEGYVVEVQGEIEILEKVNEKKSIYRALVKKTLQPIEVGSLLVPGQLPMIDPSGGPETSGVGATIIGGEYDIKRKLFGTNVLVFLDAGASQGLQVGQVLPIYANDKLRNKDSEVEMHHRILGAAKIVKLTDSFATAYVVRSRNDIIVGDFVGMPAMTASLEAAPAVETSKEPLDKPTDTPAAPDSGSDDLDLDL